MDKKTEKKCSFCGRKETQVRHILEGHDANICKQCAGVCIEDFQEIEFEKQLSNNKINILKPHEIKDKLDEYVVGQEEAKKILSVAAYNHYKRTLNKTKVDIQKTNIMLVGPSGSGKTYVIQTLSKILNVPLLIVDATSMTETGYVGDDTESILQKLYKKAEGNLELMERSIVYIDEIDKIVSKSGGSHQTLDIRGTGVQQSLLKIIEDSEVTFSIKEGMTKTEITANTKNILFVVGGAFIGLEEIIEKRTNPKNKTLGFQDTSNIEKEIKDSNIENITQDDIIKYGFIPEFVGRIPVVMKLNKLSKEELKDILVTPKNSIVKQYKELFKLDGIKLVFNENAIDYIVEEANKKNIGARGLKGVIERQMYDLMYELPKYDKMKSFTVTDNLLKDKEELHRTLLKISKKDS